MPYGEIKMSRFTIALAAALVLGAGSTAMAQTHHTRNAEGPQLQHRVTTNAHVQLYPNYGFASEYELFNSGEPNSCDFGS